MKIYTKTGDRGRTSLATGKRVSKSDLRLEAYGTADELNSHVGMSRAKLGNLSSEWAKVIDQQLGWIQNRLFDIGAILAGADMTFDGENVGQLETWIDHMQMELPALRAFILPGGGELVSEIHICRCVCRRLERNVVNWQEESDAYLSEIVSEYINRLSDYLFVLARYTAQKMEINLSIWEK